MEFVTAAEAPTAQAETPRPASRVGLVAAAVTGGAALGLLAICGPFVVPAFRRICLPYVPATPVQVANVLRALQGRRCRSVVDLGSGDGRIVLSLAANKQKIGN